MLPGAGARCLGGAVTWHRALSAAERGDDLRQQRQHFVVTLLAGSGLEPGDGKVVRFRTPDEGATSFDDVIRGTISFDNVELEDFVIVRSNGTPMFLVANAVDADSLQAVAIPSIVTESLSCESAREPFAERWKFIILALPGRFA